MSDIDDAIRPQGWELRMHPSTKRTATIGGFVAGGSGGVGSVTYGCLREPGNVLGARVVTVEDEPRVLELRDRDALGINHAYGTTGIITALEMPLAPVFPWIRSRRRNRRFAGALRIGQRVALADGIVKKLLTPLAWPIPAYFRHFKSEFPPGRSCLIAMIAEPSLDAFKSLVANAGGDHNLLCGDRPRDRRSRPLYECTWNHTTLHALKYDRQITYLQSLYPADRLEEASSEIAALFGDELMPHFEFIRFAGRVTCSGLHLIRYTSAERLDEIFALHEAHGIPIANPHVFTIEDGSRHKRADSDQLGFKHEATRTA